MSGVILCMAPTDGVPAGRIQLSEGQLRAWVDPESIVKGLLFHLPDGSTRVVEVSGENIHAILALVEAVNNDKTKVDPTVLDGELHQVIHDERWSPIAARAEDRGMFDLEVNFNDTGGFDPRYTVDGRTYDTLIHRYEPEASGWGTVQLFVSDPLDAE